MDFEITADGTKLPHPKEGPAQAEEAKTAELTVRDVDTKSENPSSMTDPKGDKIFDDIKEGHADDLLNFGPYDQKHSEAEQTPPTTDDLGPATTQPRNENPLEPIAVGHDDIIMGQQGKQEQGVVGETGLAPSNLLGDIPANPSPLLSEDPISVKPTDASGPGSTGDVAPIINLGDEHEDTELAPSERKADPLPDKNDESDAIESEIEHVEPALTSYSNEPTPKPDTSFEMPISSTANTNTELSDEAFNPIASDPITQPQNPSHAAQSLDGLSAAGEEKPMPEKTSIFPKSESPIPLEADTKLDESAGIPIASSPIITSATDPYINPDPFQEYIPPVGKKELGDHRPARIPSPSSMDAEPPTPVERSALSSLKESEEIQPVVDAEGVVEKLPLEALRHRDVQEALASVIPPAPDKPLPPTPSSESRATARYLFGHLPGLFAAFRRRVADDPRVMEILLWRDPKKSGAAFATGLVVLLSMMYCSFISVVAYFALALLTVTLGFRLYKTVMGMVQKTNDGHPFQDLLSVDTTVTPEKGHEMADKVVAELNCCTTTLKDLFLVKDIFESVKFGFVLYLLTYLGAWFNTMTLVIMGYVVLFTLPKVYEQNKEKIDEVLGQLKEKFGEISAKVKAAIPMGKKAPEPATEEKKEE